MIECPSCGRQHRSGVLFCGECGVYLSTGGPLRTEPLPDEEGFAPRANIWAIGTQASTTSKTPTSVRITLLESGRRVSLPVGPEIYLGRLDAAQGIFPDLDLTPDGGIEAGVSRRHAKIHWRDGRFFLEDMGSANGTFLNNQRLTPYLPHPLQERDELRVGRLRLIVEF